MINSVFKILYVFVLVFLITVISGCESGTSDNVNSSSNGANLYMLWTDALHDLDEARVQRTAKALKNAGFIGFVVTYDSINPRPYTVSQGTPFHALPRNGASLGGKVIENFVCNYSWDRNGRSVVLAPFGGYTDEALEYAVSLTMQFKSGSAILLSWEASKKEAAFWTFQYGQKLRQNGVNGTFYYNLVSAAKADAINYPWGEIGALPATSCGAGGGGVVINEDGCLKPASEVPQHVLNLPPVEVWVWWEEGVNQHIGEPLEITANNIAQLKN